MNSVITDIETRKELYAGNCKLCLINKKLLEITACGDATLEDAIAIKEASAKLLTEADKDVVVLADINNAGKSTSEARKVWKEMSENDKSSKIAFIGLSKVSRVIASFSIAFSNNKNMKFFATKKEALEWLQKKI